jgi:hypothetical protein
LRDHVVDETVLVIDTRFLKLFLVFAVMQVRAKLSYNRLESGNLRIIDLLEDVLKSAVVLLQDSILRGQELATPHEPAIKT